MFIKVKPKDEHELLLNVAHIMVVHSGVDGGSVIVLVTERFISCEESREEVEALIAEVSWNKFIGNN